MKYKPTPVLAALLLGATGAVSAHDALAGDVGDRFDHRRDRRH